jgi:hypothetical protein
VENNFFLKVPHSEFFLAFKSQFAPKCKRWHHGIGTLNGGKPQKSQKTDNLGKGRPDVQYIQRITTILMLGPIRAR